MAILTEAVETGRVLITKDHDAGELVFRDGARHAGVLLIDDLGEVSAEIDLIRSALRSWEQALIGGAFVRAGRNGARIAGGQQPD
jgi:predicted nuclease of predicted toxin-antitoxin system